MVNGAGFEPAATGLKVRHEPPASDETAGTSGAEITDPTLNPTPTTPKTTHIDAIRAALAGLSKDELIALLADALGGMKDTE